MVEKITYRRLGSQDMERVVRLHRAVFPRAALEGTIYESPLISRYLKQLVRFQGYQPHVFLGAFEGRSLVGYVHFKGIDTAWHLNQIAVAASYRGRGVGRTLLHDGLAMGHETGYSRFSLDVEATADKLVRWYHRFGFREVEKSYLYVKEMRANPSALTGTVVLDWDNAQAWQQAYGFSYFKLNWNGQTYLIGRIARRYYRLGDCYPEALEGILRAIEPWRRLAVLVVRQPSIETGARMLRTVWRMELKNDE